MTRLRLNREFLARHLFVTLLMLGLGGWFGYDGYVRYPRTDAVELYRSIEGSAPAEGVDLEAFKAQKIKTQKGFTLLAFLAGAIVGLHLLAVARFDFYSDETGFVCGGRHAWSDVTDVDLSKWKRKGIVRLVVGKRRIKLDAWHNLGVKEIVARLRPETVRA